MHTLSLANFARVIEGTVLGSQPYPATTIEHVATHSARIRTRAAFFALSGLRSNGRDYLAAAARNGAVAAVLRTADADERALAAGIPVIAVDDPLHSLQLLAAWWRESLSARFIAVVGSNGKTVTKDCLALLLTASSASPLPSLTARRQQRSPSLKSQYPIPGRWALLSRS
jgi:UDP-N-acetylmuramoyl-tripeptide--D-alanyl-D-alanine ligase